MALFFAAGSGYGGLPQVKSGNKLNDLSPAYRRSHDPAHKAQQTDNHNVRFFHTDSAGLENVRSQFNKTKIKFR